MTIEARKRSDSSNHAPPVTSAPFFVPQLPTMNNTLTSSKASMLDYDIGPARVGFTVPKIMPNTTMAWPEYSKDYGNGQTKELVKIPI